jgi:hypothetical protein
MRYALRKLGFSAFSTTILALVVAAGAAWGQTDVRPGFNLFTVDQDVEIGKKSAVEVERQLPMLSQPATSRYIADLGARLAAQAPGAKYKYQRSRISPTSTPSLFPAGLSTSTGASSRRFGARVSSQGSWPTKSRTSHSGTRRTRLRRRTSPRRESDSWEAF